MSKMLIGNWDDPIRKVPLSDNMGNKSSAGSVQKEDVEKGWNEVGVVSDKYLLVENQQVEKLAHDIAESSGYNFTPDKTFWNGRQLMYSKVAKDYTDEVSVGDDVGLGIMFWNSYDGSTALQFKLYLQRLVCLNGMVSNDIFKSFRFKHDESSENYQEEIIEAAQIIESSRENVRYFINALRYLDKEELDFCKLSTIRQEHLSHVPTTLFGNIVDELLNYRPLGKPTAYDLLNSSTKVLWHKKKSTKADFDHNASIVDSLVNYAKLGINKEYN